MARMQTDLLIRVAGKKLFAQFGYEGLSMRTLAQESGVGLSSIYHFFKDKDVLLREIYQETNRGLGQARKSLPKTQSAESMLAQLIHFQFDRMEDVVYVLKYYLHFREYFATLPTKTLPAKSILHVEEVLLKGIKTQEFNVKISDIPAKAKVVAHTISGYLLEYYPEKPRGAERNIIVNDIVAFTMQGLK